MRGDTHSSGPGGWPVSAAKHHDRESIPNSCLAKHQLLLNNKHMPKRKQERYPERWMERQSQI